MTLFDKILNDDWTNKHSIPCINKYLLPTTFGNWMMQKIDTMTESKIKKDDFISKLAEELKKLNELDIKNTISCISTKMQSVYEDVGMFYSLDKFENMAYISLSWAIYMICVNTGFLSPGH